jgi:hypothetical protein
MTLMKPLHVYDEAIARLLAGKRDPEAGRKAREDMDKGRNRMRVGTVDVAVDLIRAARDR